MTRMLTLAATTSIATLALGQDAPPDAPPADAAAKPTETGFLQTREPIRYRAAAGVQHALESSLDDVAGDLAVTRAAYSFTAMIPAAERLDLELTFDQVWSYYDFSGGTALVPGTTDPWDGVAESTLGLDAMIVHSPAWIITLGGELISAMETDAEFEDSLTGAIRGGVVHVVNENLSIGGGLYVRRRIVRDDALFAPTLIVNWRIDDEWSLAAGGGTVEAGPGVTVAYAPSEAYEFFAEIRGIYHEFALDNDGPLPGGVASQFGARYGIGVRWNASERVRFEGALGLSSTEIDVHNAADVEVGATDVDSQVVLRASVSIRL